MSCNDEEVPELLADLYTLDYLEDTLMNAINKKENFNRNPSKSMILFRIFSNSLKIDDEILFCILISKCIEEWGLKFANTDNPILKFYQSLYEKCLKAGVAFKNIQHQLLNSPLINQNQIQNLNANETSKIANKSPDEFSSNRI